MKGKKMKIIKIVIASLTIIFIFSNVSAAEGKDEILKYEDAYYELFEDELSDDTVEILEKSGIDSIDFKSIVSAEPKDILLFFKNTAEGTIKGPLKNFVFNCSVLLLLSVVFTYSSENEKRKKSLNLLAFSYIALSVCIPMASVLKSGAAAIKMSSKFMTLFLPVLGGIVAASGNPTLALNYNSFALYFAHALTSFSSNILLPFETMMFALVSVNMISDQMNVKNLAKSIKNGVVKTLSIAGAIFTAVLSVKGVLSNVADTVASKGAKVLVSSLIPVVGSSVSDAYGTIANSLLLLKSSVGVFGIAAIAAINLPVIIQLSLWSLSMSFSSAVADVLGLNSIADYFREVSNTVRIFNVILIFCCVLFIISTGILLLLKNSI